MEEDNVISSIATDKVPLVIAPKDKTLITISTPLLCTTQYGLNVNELGLIAVSKSQLICSPLLNFIIFFIQFILI